MGKSANQEYLINDQVIYKITRNFEQNFSQSMLLPNEASSPWKQTYFNQVLDSSRAQMPKFLHKNHATDKCWYPFFEVHWACN